MDNSENWNQYWWKRSEEEGTQEQILEAAGRNFPRPEYVSGEVKLAYRHRFLSGHVLSFSENAEGLVSVVLELPNGGGARSILLAKASFLMDSSS